jgi:hypothetical protein
MADIKQMEISNKMTPSKKLTRNYEKSTRSYQIKVLEIKKMKGGEGEKQENKKGANQGYRSPKKAFECTSGRLQNIKKVQDTKSFKTFSSLTEAHKNNSDELNNQNPEEESHLVNEKRKDVSGSEHCQMPKYKSIK